MKTPLLYGIISLLLFTSCQTLYTYRLPNESERKRFADSVHWGYSGATITSIPVVDENGSIYRLEVNPKTKIEIVTVYGEKFRFYLQTVKINGDDELLGMGKMWAGFDLLNHTQKSVLVQEINTMTILSDDKAVKPIAIR